MSPRVLAHLGSSWDMLLGFCLNLNVPVFSIFHSKGKVEWSGDRQIRTWLSFYTCHPKDSSRCVWKRIKTHVFWGLKTMSLSVQKDAAVVFTTQQDIRIKAVMSRSLSVHEKQIYVSCVLSKNICNCGTPAKLQSPFSALFVTYFSSCFFSRSTTTLKGNSSLYPISSLEQETCLPASLCCLLCNSHVGLLCGGLPPWRKHQGKTAPLLLPLAWAAIIVDLSTLGHWASPDGPYAWPVWVHKWSFPCTPRMIQTTEPWQSELSF